LGDVETLTIPIDTTVDVQVGGLGISGEPLPLDIELSGNIVATVAVPEPDSLGLLAVSAIMLLRRLRRAGCHH
jgi:hypothetical protein